MLPKFRKTLLLGLVLSLSAVAPVFPAGESDGDKGDKFLNHALLEDCRPMEDFLAEGDAAAAAGDVENAIRKYQAALEIAVEVAPDAMYFTDESPDAGIERYRPGRELCRARLMRMSEDDLAVYCMQFDPQARSELRGAVARLDSQTLLAIGEKYPFAPGGLNALETAGRIFAESGDATLAAYCYETMLATYERWPSTATREQYALTLARVAAAYCEIGDGGRLAGLARMVRGDAKLSAEKLRVRGETAQLGAYVAAKAAAVVPRVEAAVSGYPSFGGDASGSALMDGLAGRPGGEMWRYDIADAHKSVISSYPPDALETRPMLVSTLAAACDGRVFVNTGSKIVALEEYDGSKAFDVSFDDRDAASVQANNAWSGGIPTPTFCAVADGVVYALAREWQRNYYSWESGRLLAVDAKSGRKLWAPDAAQKLFEGIEDGRGVGTFTGPVTVAEGRLYVAVCSSSMVQRRNYLVCADAKTGERLWHCFLGEKRGDFIRANEASLPAYVVLSGGTAVVTIPEMGLVAAVDTRRGKLAWALKYHQDLYGKLGFQGNMQQIASRIISVSHPIAKDGRVIYAPRNSNSVYCFEADSGDVVWRTAMPDLNYVAGLDGGQLYCIAGGKLATIDADTGKRADLAISFGGDIVGRPAMTKDSIYVSTSAALYRYDRASGTREHVVSWRRGKTFPANVIAVESALYLVNSEGVTARRGAGLIERYDALLKANPDDVELRIRRGRAHMADADFKDALVDLKVAEEHAAEDVKVFGRASTAVVGENLAVCYRGLMDYYFVSERYDEALEYANLALQYAGSRGVAAGVLLRKAEILERRGDEASIRGSFDVYTEMIAAEEGMLPLDDGMDVASHFYAAAQITGMIKKYGRQNYAAHEIKAAAALAAIEAGTAAEGCDRLRLFYEYPNSLAALKGLAQMAAESEKAGARSRALMLCKIAARNYEDCPELAPALETLQRLAGDFGEDDNARHALARLAGMTDVAMSDGRPAAQFAAARLEEIEKQAEIARSAAPLDPDAKLTHKIELDDSVMYKNGQELRYDSYQASNVVPRIRGRRPECMVGKTLIKRGTMIECYDLTTGAELWYNCLTNKWLGFGLYDSTRDLNRQCSKEAREKGLDEADEVLTVGGRSIKNYADVEAAIKDCAFGEKLEVVYRPYNGKDPREKLPPKSVMLTVSKPPSTMTGVVDWAFYSGETLVVCASAAQNELMNREPKRIYCIDLKTGETLWTNQSGLDWRWREESGRIAANNLLPLAHSRGESTLVSLMDCASGNNVLEITLPIDDPRAYIAHAGDSIVTVCGRQKECEVYDALTGRIRMRMRLGMGADDNFGIAGERLLCAKDAVGEIHVWDMFDGKVIRKALDNEPNRRAQRCVSDRYMLFGTAGSGASFILLDAWDLKQTEIKPTHFASKVEISEGRIICVGLNHRQRMEATVFDAASGRAVWHRETSCSGYVNIVDVDGDYMTLLVMAYKRRETGGRTPDGRYPIYDTYTQVDLFVVDLRTGEEVIDRTLMHDGRVERNCAIIDGRLCMALTKYLYIYATPHGKN